MSWDKNTYFAIISLSVVFGLTLPVLIQDAMFQDAVLYSSVAHNLSIGHGTFWFPQYSALNLEGIPSFHEQPPLVFGIMSLFYKLFGSSIYVERVYTVLMIVLNIYFIRVLWKEVYLAANSYSKMWWLPVFFWIIIPVCFWSFRNNMIENTMGVFILISVIISIKSIQKENFWLGWITSGLFIFLASFSKGVPGFFPIVLPLIWWFVYREVSLAKALQYFAVLVLIPSLIYGIILMFPGPRESLSIYFFDRLIRRVDDMHTTFNRFETARKLFVEMLPVLISVSILMLVKGKPFFKRIAETKKEFWFFLLLGFAGSLPLMLTKVQKGWYMVPSFPFFAIAFASICLPFVSEWLSHMTVRSVRVVKTISFILASGVLVVTALQFGKISREEAILTDVYKIGKVVPQFTTMSVPKEQYDQYNFILQGFLVRHFFISISPEKNLPFFLTEKGKKVAVPYGYEEINLDLRKYSLYKQKINIKK
ncbi:MAG: glycosyltransferase family 39 protein [Saprospiraceae bacterium]|nr:glycosyltransferase family 39 protein [Saprospiraceae bacterium]